MTTLSTATSLKRAPAAVDIEDRIDGSRVLCSPLALLPQARCIGEYLEIWARKTPERLTLAERFEAGWRQVNHRDALMTIPIIAGNFLCRRLSIDRSTSILSRSSIIARFLHLVKRMRIYVAPISPASS